MTDKIQALERFTNENKKNTQKETEEFRQEPAVPMHEEIEEGCPKVLRKRNLVYQIMIQEWPADDRHTQGYAEVMDPYGNSMVFIHPM